MPLVLQRAVETCARSAPLSWSISGCSSSCNASISWVSEPSTTPPTSSSSFQMFPTAVLNAVSAPSASNLSWTVYEVAGILSAKLSWSTVPAPESATPPAASPASPVVTSSSPASDAGYFSASPPTSTSRQSKPSSPLPIRALADSLSPIPSTPSSPSPDSTTSDSELASSNEAAVQTSHKFKQTQDAATTTPKTSFDSIAVQTTLQTNSIDVQTTPPPVMQSSACQTDNTSPEPAQNHADPNLLQRPKFNKQKKRKSKKNRTTNAVQPKAEPTKPVLPQPELYICKLCQQMNITRSERACHMFDCTGNPMRRVQDGALLDELTKRFVTEGQKLLNIPPTADYTTIYEIINKKCDGSVVHESWMDDMLDYGTEGVSCGEHPEGACCEEYPDCFERDEPDFAEDDY